MKSTHRFEEQEYREEDLISQMTASKGRPTTLKEFLDDFRSRFPDASFEVGYHDDGQVVLYTGLRVSDTGELETME